MHGVTMKFTLKLVYIHTELLHVLVCHVAIFRVVKYKGYIHYKHKMKL